MRQYFNNYYFLLKFGSIISEPFGKCPAVPTPRSVNACCIYFAIIYLLMFIWLASTVVICVLYFLISVDLLYVNDCYTADILQLYSYCQSNGCSRCARAPTPVVISQLGLLLVISTLRIGGITQWHHSQFRSQNNPDKV